MKTLNQYLLNPLAWIILTTASIYVAAVLIVTAFYLFEMAFSK